MSSPFKPEERPRCGVMCKVYDWRSVDIDALVACSVHTSGAVIVPPDHTLGRLRLTLARVRLSPCQLGGPVNWMRWAEEAATAADLAEEGFEAALAEVPRG